MAERWKLDQGFEVYEDPNSEAGRYSNTPGVLEEILERASRWIEDHSSQRFFCFIHTYVVHEPYAPPPGYDRMFDEGYTGPMPWRIGLHDCLELNKTVRHPDEPDVRHIVSLYDAEIRYMDDHLGEFLDRLTHLGLHRNTVIVFVADHGEEFAEHGRVGRHGHTLFDELLHVPLLMRIPGVQPRVIERQVRLIDVAPTLLALMKIDPGDVALQGRDLLADDGLRGPDLPVLSQWPSPIGLWASLRYPDRKIHGLDGRMFSFYQLDKDPAERNDCFNWDDDVHKQMVKEIQALMAENNDLVRHSAPPIELEPEAEEELRSLGYLE